MYSIPVVSFVAYSGTGKTTLVEQVVRKLKGHGVRVAVIKHDGHDFEVDHKGKDSWRMSQAGADVSIVTSDTHTAIMENRPLSADEIISRVHNVDIILTEGFKHGKWPKILLHRKDNHKELPINPDQCIAVLTDEPIVTTTPCYPLGDVDSVIMVLRRFLPEFLS